MRVKVVEIMPLVDLGVSSF